MFETFRSRKNRQFYFRARARNGKILAQSEGYKTKRSRDKGLAALLHISAGYNEPRIVDVWVR
jgi:uncharacterized protein YegP (UPF0339 family)